MQGRKIQLLKDYNSIKNRLLKGGRFLGLITLEYQMGKEVAW